MHSWHRWREPLAITLLVALALMLVVRGVAFWLAVEAGTAGGLLGSIPGGDDLLLLASAGAALWCATPTPVATATGGGAAHESADDRATLSPHAWPIAVAGLAIVGLTVLGWLGLWLWNVITLVSWPTPELGFLLLVVEGLLRLAVPAVALVAVILAVRRAGIARTAAARPELPALSTAASGGGEQADETAVSAPAERLPAAWHADEATGAVWLTADDAAQGRPGLSWADPGGRAGQTDGGWAPSPTGRLPADRLLADGSSAGVHDSAEAPGAGGPEAAAAAQNQDPRSAAEDDDLR